MACPLFLSPPSLMAQLMEAATAIMGATVKAGATRHVAAAVAAALLRIAGSGNVQAKDIGMDNGQANDLGLVKAFTKGAWTDMLTVNAAMVDADFVVKPKAKPVASATGAQVAGPPVPEILVQDELVIVPLSISHEAASLSAAARKKAPLESALRRGPWRPRRSGSRPRTIARPMRKA